MFFVFSDQKLGLLKYNSNFIFKKENSIRMIPTKSSTNRTYNTQSNKKGKHFSCRSLKYDLNKTRVQKEDIIFRNEIIQFIEESTSNNEIKINHSNLVKIKHNIDDDVIDKRNNMNSGFYPYKTQTNWNLFKVNHYNIY